MEWLNRPAYLVALELLAPTPADALLEIGFGTGGLLEIFARRIRQGTISGVDPSPLMCSNAARRLQRFVPGVRLDLRQGTDRDLNWSDASFDHVAALHSFQFWPNPKETLLEIYRLLRPNGRLVLILRSHATHAPDWLPNPISRGPEESVATTSLLRGLGFSKVKRHRDVGSSTVITAERGNGCHRNEAR
jgi:ubiquinone/menaquinone biosynthesis C-methylase UbiE